MTHLQSRSALFVPPPSRHLSYYIVSLLWAQAVASMPVSGLYTFFVTSMSDLLLTSSYPFNGPLSVTTRVSRYQKGKTNLDFTEARDSEWQWNQLGQMQVCTSLQTDNHASTPTLSLLQAGCPSCRPTNSVKA